MHIWDSLQIIKISIFNGNVEKDIFFKILEYLKNIYTVVIK